MNDKELIRLRQKLGSILKREINTPKFTQRFEVSSQRPVTPKTHVGYLEKRLEEEQGRRIRLEQKVKEIKELLVKYNYT